MIRRAGIAPQDRVVFAVPHGRLIVPGRADGNVDMPNTALARFRAGLKRPAFSRLLIVLLWSVHVLLVHTIAADAPSPQPDASHFLHGFVDSMDDLHPLARWDGVWYLSIAEHGYGARSSREPGLANFAFFPLYPAAVAAVQSLTGVPTQPVALAVSSLCVLIAMLLILEWGRAQAHRGWALWAPVLTLVCLPSAYIFHALYAEAMLLCLVAASYYGFHQRRMALAICAGVLAGLARPHAIAHLLPFALLAWRGYRAGDLDRRLAVLWSLSPLVGVLLFFLYLRLSFDSATLYIDAKHGFFGNTSLMPIATRAMGLLRDSVLLSNKHPAAHLDIIGLVALVGAGLFFALGRARDWAWVACCVSYAGLGVLAGTTWGLGRHILTAVPVLWVLPALLKRHPSVLPVAIVVWFLGLWLQVGAVEHFASFLRRAP